jgi:N-acetylglucosaminyl-diphospho-decaprenol L-rhamnosyltransferase
MNNSNKITVSIVSHGQFNLIIPLLENLKKYSLNLAKIIITINIPETTEKLNWYKDFPILWIYNKSILGFGENHNNAFKNCTSKYFCILNPDIRIKDNIFLNLIKIKEKEKINIFSPTMLDVNKNKSINSRKFPNFFYLFSRIKKMPKRYFYKQNQDVLFTDWIGGMFMLISTKDFKILNGFDTDFFLYFEDIDICKRAKNIGFIVGEARNFNVIHNAQRQSRSSLKHFLYYIKSYFMYLKKHFF